jgi:hypothetical protein
MTESWRERNKEHVREYDRKYREENHEAKITRMANWRNANREKITEYNKKKYWENPEKRRSDALKAYWANIDESRERARNYASITKNKIRSRLKERERVSRDPEYYKKRYRRYQEAMKEHAARRRIHKYKSSANLTEDQIQQMRDIYWHARDLSAVTGEPYEVDHIIPIRGANVCGLHVPWNLQILPRDLNRAKRNQYNVEDAIAT